jgi:hypothetical protein
MNTLERIVNSKYGQFKFELVDYPGPSPMISIYLDSTHLGYVDYIDLDNVTDLDLLTYCSSIRYNDNEDEWS